MQKLRQEIGNLHEQMVALSNKAKNEQRSFSAEENTKYEALMQDFESKRKELSRAEAELEREKYLNEVVSPVLGQNPKGEDEDLNEENHMRSFVNYLRNGSCRRKNKISIWKNKTSIKVEILFFYKP